MFGLKLIVISKGAHGRDIKKISGKEWSPEN